VLWSRLNIEQMELRQTEVQLRHMLVEAREDQDNDDIADALLELGRIAYAWNDLEGVERQAQEVCKLGKQLQNEEMQVHAVLLLVRVRHARGETIGALQQLNEQLAWLQPYGVPLRTWLFHEVLAMRARLQLVVGDLATVERWVNSRVQHQALLPLLQQEREEALVARLLIMQGKAEEVQDLLWPLADRAMAQGRIRSAMEMKLVMALAHAACKRISKAKPLLQEVVARACSEGDQRIFLDEGEQMATLLQTCLPGIQGKMQIGFVRGLLRAFAQGQTGRPAGSVDQLSAQEMRVLRLLVAGHSNPEIAGELVVSVNTVKTHIQNIYRKLHVENRVGASEVARLLHLL
jgi:LuxR family maltose regulon positive regulatory protein